MSETTTEQQLRQPAEYRTPEQEQAAKGADIRPVDEVALEDINPVNAHLFKDNRWPAYFERLRAEDPVHFNELGSSGRYWLKRRIVYRTFQVRLPGTGWRYFQKAYIAKPPASNNNMAETVVEARSLAGADCGTLPPTGISRPIGTWVLSCGCVSFDPPESRSLCAGIPNAFGAEFHPCGAAGPLGV